MATVYYGPLITPQSPSSYKASPQCLLALSPAGNIDWIVDDVPASMVHHFIARNAPPDAVLIALNHGEFIIPGFVDTHTHAPQVPNIGSGQQFQLLDWLENVTFPVEATFADPEFARRTYPHIVQRFINAGTTTCCYYGTLHLDATKILADIIHAKGQRAFVGKCNMDRNCPDYYREASASSSIHDTKALIAHIRSMHHRTPEPLVNPILTPRFAISCTPPLLASLGALADADPALPIQTHISENRAEVALTRSLFPDARSYADVYDRSGLLRRNTILAHAVWLADDEVALVKQRGAGVAHCPTSNFNLNSGVAPVGRYLDAGIKVGLGTDVSGGYSTSMLTAVRHASIASKVLAMHTPRTAESSPLPDADADADADTRSVSVSPHNAQPHEAQPHEAQPHNAQPHDAQPHDDTPPSTTFANRPLPVSALFYLATLGGAQVCSLDSRVGSLEPGKAFDALVVSVREDTANPSIWGVGSALDAAGSSVWGVGGGPTHDTDTAGPTHATANTGKDGGRQVTREMLDVWLERFLFCGDDRNVRRVVVQGRVVGGSEGVRG